MPTAYIETTIAAAERGVSLFECECVAEIEYQADGRDLTCWYVKDFRFDEFSHEWDTKRGQFRHRKVSEAWCPDDLRPFLLRHVDRHAIEAQLVQLIRADALKEVAA